MKLDDLDVVEKQELQAQSIRADILNIQKMCQELPDGHRMDESPPLVHWFANGTYAREIHLKADSLVVGKIHRFEHLSIISKGRVTVYTEYGIETYEAPVSFVSPAGIKRVVYTHEHEDAIWTTFHANPTGETDITKLECLLVSTDYKELGIKVKEMKGIT